MFVSGIPQGLSTSPVIDDHWRQRALSLAALNLDVDSQIVADLAEEDVRKIYNLTDKGEMQLVPIAFVNPQVRECLNTKQFIYDKAKLKDD